MKRAYYGPYMRFFMNKIHGKKIIGKASKDEIERLCRKVTQSISKVDSKRTEDEIFKELIEKLKIVYTEQLPAFSGTKGIALGSRIFIDQIEVYKFINSDIETIEDSDDYQTIIHECIHKLQKPKLSFKGKSVRGFVEGATELMALRATRKNRSHNYSDCSTNFPETAYVFPVSVMQQLEIFFGKELVEEYALYQNQELLIKLNELLGNEQFNLFRNDINSMALNKEPGNGMDYWQNSLLEKYFDSEIENVQSLQDAKNFLNRLKQMELARVRINGDDLFKSYYIEKLNELSKRYPEINSKEYEYKESEFYPALYMDEEIERLDELLLTKLTPDSENLEAFKRINLDDYKRYRLTINDKIYEVTTVCGEIKYFDTINKNNKYASFYKNNDDKKFYCGSYSTVMERTDDMERIFTQSKTEISFVDGKMYLSVNPPLSNTSIDNQEMAEVPLNITKEDIYNRMLEEERIFIRNETLVEKIKRFFTKPKLLPPYSQVQEKSKGNDFREIYELNTEEKKKIEQARVESLKRKEDNKEHGNMENIIDINHENT